MVNKNYITNTKCSKGNPSYRKGRRKEYKVVNQAKSEGHIAFRSAGSHSPIDVIDIDTKNKVIKLIQCKPDTMTDTIKQRLHEQNKQLNGTYIVTFEVI